VTAAPITFLLVASAGCQMSTGDPILTAPQLGKLPKGLFAVIAPAGQTATLSTPGDTLYATLRTSPPG